MKLIGVDYGKAKIGIAYSEGLLPSPLTTIAVRTKKQALADIQQLCGKLGIEKIIIGLPKGVLDKEARQFGELLTKQTHIPIDFVDETLSSRYAVEKMIEGKTTKKKRRVMEDSVAATIILNTYLENNKN